MLCDGEPHRCAPTLPGLEHLRVNVKDWDAAARTLSFTSATIAESIGAAASPAQTRTATPATECYDLSRFPPQAAPAPPPAPPATLEVISAAQLKPGRLFIVANLRGAYYTLLELLSRHKFDFRSDNLMHLGNLVAPPAPLLAMMVMQPQPQPHPRPQTPPSHAIATAAAADGGAPAAAAAPAVAAATGGGGAAPSVCRNTAPLLKLMRRHGGLGPMGANECLTLLAAARANRQRAEQERTLQQEQLQLQQVQMQAGAAASRFQGRRSALSLQLAAAAAAASSPTPQPPQLGCGSLGQRAAPPPPPGRPAVAACSSASSDSDSDDSNSESDDSNSSAGAGSDAEAGLAGGSRMAPCPHDPVPALPARAAAPPSPPPAPPAPSPSPRWGARGGGGGGLDDGDLTYLMSMPASILVQPYGILLQHAGPADRTAGAGASVGAGGGGRYHVIYSHRRAAAAAGAGAAAGAAGGAATCTGLSSCREVVRCAVLPPLRTLQRRSPGFAARAAVAGVGAGAMGDGLQEAAVGVAGAQVGALRAPSRDELMLEVVEEPLSELDLPPPPVTSVPTGF